ncbi:MAG: hypothetical protein QMA95_01415 [Aquiluna sp.]|jgi:uncharacterized membrane protein
MKYIKVLLQIGLGFGLLSAGISHLTTARAEFRAQVPTWLPLDADFVVIASGIVEISLGIGLLILWKQLPRKLIGLAAALFFIAIFPGNLSQWINGVSAFGLDTDQARFMRLFFQPVLVVWALISTNAYRLFRRKKT